MTIRNDQEGLSEYSSAGLASQRLDELLEVLAMKGLTQIQIAAKTGLPPQYLSDIKCGRRPMTELVARRLGEGFEVNYQWLMGISDRMERPQSSPAAPPAGGTLWLPLFPHPIAGEPRAHPQWDGTGVEIAGPAAARRALLAEPYLLRFGHNDAQGRLRKGDLILMSQVPKDEAEIHVVRYRKKCFLARVKADGGWSRVADGTDLSRDCPAIGHCVGIVWGPLS